MVTALIIIITIIFLIVFIFILKYLRDIKYISLEFFRQVVSSIISGIIVALVAFFSAYFLWQIQESKKLKQEKQVEEQRIKDAREEAIITLSNEISENRVILAEDIKSNVLVRIPLKISAWEAGKYRLPIENSGLKTSLLVLYNFIEKYNWDTQFIQHRVEAGRLTSTKYPEDAKKAQAAFDKELLDALTALEKLMNRELVALGCITKDDYAVHFGKWEDKVSLPFVKQKQIE